MQESNFTRLLNHNVFPRGSETTPEGFMKVDNGEIQKKLNSSSSNRCKNNSLKKNKQNSNTYYLKLEPNL